MAWARDGVLLVDAMRSHCDAWQAQGECRAPTPPVCTPLARESAAGAPVAQLLIMPAAG